MGTKFSVPSSDAKQTRLSLNSRLDNSLVLFQSFQLKIACCDQALCSKSIIATTCVTMNSAQSHSFIGRKQAWKKTSLRARGRVPLSMG